jgi:ankyrin repeat protein
MLAALLPSNVEASGRRRDDSNKALVKAAREGHTSYLRSLVAKGAAPDTRDENGWTPLIHASAAGHEEIVRFLLQSGAVPNARTANGLTAATLASANGHALIVRMLFDAEHGVGQQARTPN